MRKRFSKGAANTNGQKWIKYLIGEYYTFCQNANKIYIKILQLFLRYLKQFLFSLQTIEIKEHAQKIISHNPSNPK